ncbi:MAG TPA: hypothetical protein DEG96_05070 [Candidatus Atribacteria bacterium]|uniref:Formylmethanofuran--tetrahydromethanopterin formyltransferase n=1 Tax=candidate division TA06 bacterium 34_109 TaxID=1635277 RepID=A0A117M636_UNCT6|nr:MAG: Formylmethanofuran--tetrahydromethanopterin formyltransferase [candidate division TA06 bacterium 34_109]HBY57216.1 hypothetical protein [Candidatus Atribacteria bacterium]
MKYKGIEIEEVNCECTDLRICRGVLTALTEEIALHEARYLSGFGLITASPIQTCIEGILPESETPDRRRGIIIQFNVPSAVSYEKFREALLKRLFIVPHLPTCSLFDVSSKKEGTFINIGEYMRRWGDGFEVSENYQGRDVYKIPIMTGDMLIEKTLSVYRGLDAALEIFAQNAVSCIVASQEATCRIFHEVPGVALFNYPIGGVSGAKVGGINYSKERVTINHSFCPTLRNTVKDGNFPAGTEAVIEYPIVGLDENSIKQALKVAIDTFATTPGIIKITSPTFEGQWGERKIYLPEII